MAQHGKVLAAKGPVRHQKYFFLLCGTRDDKRQRIKITAK